MKIFVTGATGYVGGAVTDRLLERGHAVEGLARSDTAAAALAAKGVRVRPGSVEDLEALRAGAAEADAVVHAFRGGSLDAFRVLETAATRALLGALEGTGKAFVYTIGSLGTGDTGPDTPVDETTPANPPPFLAWRSELEAEVLAAHVRGVRSIVIRAPMIYGRGTGFVTRSLIEEVRAVGVVHHVGAGDNLLAFVHVDDLADLYARAIDEAPPGSVYLAANDDVLRYRDFARLASEALGARGTAALTVEQAAAAFGPFATALTYSQRLSSARAQRELGWRTTRHGIAEELRRVGLDQRRG